MDGDKIILGKTELIYHGISASIASKSGISISKFAPNTPSIITQPALLQKASKSTFKTPPDLEGKVVYIDGPHRIEKDKNLIMQILGATVLGLLTRGYLTGLPFWNRQELMVWYFRVEELTSGRLTSVVMSSKRPIATIALGDQVSIWGKFVDGNLILDSAYIHGQNCWIKN